MSDCVFCGDPNPTRPIWEHVHPPGRLSDTESAAVISAIRDHLG